jgi:xylose dehydrogenase (NAD/NADP)
VGLRLGLLSTARINAKLVAGAAEAPDIEVVAVGGRDPERTAAHARELGVPRALGSYEELLADPGVDAVYIALPNALHAEWALRALQAGKHVLVEKPFSTDAAEVQRCFDEADARGLVLTEGFMWRHHPQVARLTELIAEGAIGELRLVRAAFSFVLDRDGDVRWDPALAGGALLDVGAYCVSAARLLAGEPLRVQASAVLAASGVDVRVAGVLEHAGDVLSVFDCAFDLPYRASLEAIGSLGTVRLLDPWHAEHPAIELLREGDEAVREEPAAVSHYGLELADLAAAVRDGRPPLLGRNDAVGQARALALVREALS